MKKPLYFVIGVIVILGLIWSFTRNKGHNNPYNSPSPIASKMTGDVEDGIELAGIRAHQGKFDEAVKMLEDLQKQDPSNPNIPLKLAEIYELKGDYGKALEVCNKSLENFADNYSILDEKSAILFKLNRFEEAAVTSDRILTLESEYPDMTEETLQRARLQAARAYKKEPDNKKIAKIFDNMTAKIDKKLKVKPGDESYLKDKGALLRAAGKYNEAVAVYRQVKESEKKNLFVPLFISRSYMEAGDYKAAEKEFEKVIKENPNNFRSYRNYAWYWRERAKKAQKPESLEMYDKSINYFEKCLSLAPLSIDKTWAKRKIAEVKYLRWRDSQTEEDKKAALAAFKFYKDTAPDDVSTDIVDDYIAHLNGEKVVEITRDEEEPEFLPVVQ